jgi:hypothetical protein
VRRRRFRPLELGGDLARAVVSFFDDQEAWLVGVLEQGRE